MSWWKKLWPFSKQPALPDGVFRIHFDMPDWTEQPPSNKLRRWNSPYGSVLSLGDLGSEDWFSITTSKLRDEARRLAAAQGAGLIEISRFACGSHLVNRLIYKRLPDLGYVFTGMFMIRLHGAPLVWTMVDGERGMTGVREAVVMAELVKLTNPKSEGDLQKLWGEDPYDTVSLGVDSRVRRFTSDGEEYDARFPEHPLSRVRGFLNDLCVWIQANSDGPLERESLN